MMHTIDLRSDTVTLPTPEMLRAITSAPLGDDVYGEDPTINRLEALAAEKAGKEDALLVVSGTMGNLCALLAHCARGDEALIGDESHIYHYEGGGASVLGGIALHPIRTMRRQRRAAARRARHSHPRPLRRSRGAHAADLPGEHAQPLWRHGAVARLYA